MNVKNIKIKTIYGAVVDIEKLLDEEEVNYFDFVEGNGWVSTDKYMEIMERWALQRSRRRE